MRNQCWLPGHTFDGIHGMPWWIALWKSLGLSNIRSARPTECPGGRRLRKPNPSANAIDAIHRMPWWTAQLIAREISLSGQMARLTRIDRVSSWTARCARGRRRRRCFLFKECSSVYHGTLPAKKEKSEPIAGARNNSPSPPKRRACSWHIPPPNKKPSA